MRQMKNAAAMLLVSQGIPMILMGDEVGRTQGGNNNTYCHDNDHNWFDWWLVEENAELLRFFRNMIAFRHAHPVLRGRDHLRHADYRDVGLPDISWHGTRAWQPDWSGTSRVLAFMLTGKHAKSGACVDDDIYVAMNSYWEPLEFHLPPPSTGRQWHLAVDTSATTPNDCQEAGNEARLGSQDQITVGGRSVVILVGR
jgi:glycogen operon protein